MKKQNNSNIVKFHKPIQINISIIICIIIFIYILFHIYSYFTADNISIYEVKQGSIATNNEYTALAIRDESIVYSSDAGYIYYYAKNKSKVGVRSCVYAVDHTGDITTKLNNKEFDVTDIDEDDLKLMENSISSFMNNYSDNEFYRIYAFKSDLSDSLSQIYNSEAVNELSVDIDNAINSEEYTKYYAQTAGLVVYSTDGMENVTVDNFSEENFDQSNYTSENLKLNTSITAGQAVYKLVNSDRWNLIIPVSQSVAESLSEKTYLDIKFSDDDAKTWGAFYIENRAGQDYIIMSLDDSMNRYADERYVNVELLLDETDGLKIPNSAITTKTFYLIPKSYFMSGNDSDDEGLMISGNAGDQFITPTIYYEDDENYYVDENDVPKGSVIKKADSLETYTVGAKQDKLYGVYNVNKGYAVFKQIKILYKTADYAIIENGTNYGVCLYDHIALDGNSVTENQIIDYK